MVEQKNKDVKMCDEANIKAVNAKMNTNPSEEQRYIMDALAQLFSGREDATYDGCFDEFFVDAPQFGSTVRRCKPEKLDKEAAKAIARKVN